MLRGARYGVKLYAGGAPCAVSVPYLFPHLRRNGNGKSAVTRTVANP